MRKTITLCFLLPFLLAFSQNENTQRKNLILELGGNGLIYSVGLEHANFKNKRLKDSFRVGAGYIPEFIDSKDFYVGFLECNFDFGKNKNYLELGIGPSITYLEFTNLLINGRVGYRYNSDSFIFRVGLTPIFITPVNANASFRFWGGISLGFPLNIKEKADHN